MKPYKDFQPTGFDQKGLGLEDRQDWLVMDVSRTRDSGIRDESNWHATLKALREADPEGETFEVHRFGHWGPGWFEIILVKPGTPAETVAEEIEGALSDYPILDDDDHSRREWDAACEAWENSSVADRVELIQECNRFRKQISVFAARRAELPQGDDQGVIFERLLQS